MTIYVDVTSDPVAHCVVTLYAPDGTIIIQQERNFNTPTPMGGKLLGVRVRMQTLMVMGYLHKQIQCEI